MKTNKKVMLSIALLMVNSAAFASEDYKAKARKAAANVADFVKANTPTVAGTKQAIANGTAKTVNFVKANAPTVAGTKQAVVNGASSALDAVKSHPVATGALIAGTAVVAGVAGTQKGRDAVKSAATSVVTGVTSAATKTKAAASSVATSVYNRMPNMPTFRRAAAPVVVPTVDDQNVPAAVTPADAQNVPAADAAVVVPTPVATTQSVEEQRELVIEVGRQAAAKAVMYSDIAKEEEVEHEAIQETVTVPTTTATKRTWKQAGSAVLSTVTRGYAGTSIAKQEEAARIELAKQEEAARIAREQAFINDAVNVLDASSTSVLKDMFVASLSSVNTNVRYFSQQGITVRFKGMLQDLLTESNFPETYNGTSLAVIAQVNYLLKLSTVKALNLTSNSTEYAEFLDTEIARVRSVLQS